MSEINVKLIKLSNNKTRLRTSEIYGVCSILPTPGYSFEVKGTPLEDGEAVCRLVGTSPVKRIVVKGTLPTGNLFIDFETENSLYSVEVLSYN